MSNFLVLRGKDEEMSKMVEEHGISNDVESSEMFTKQDCIYHLTWNEAIRDRLKTDARIIKKEIEMWEE